MQIKNLFFVLLLAALLFFFYQIFFFTTEKQKSAPKIILAWNDFFGRDPFFGQSTSCSFNGACLLTKNRSLISVADVVAFHSRDTKDLPSPEDRKTHQVYLYWNMESPANAGGFKFPENYFNRTMSFSPKSDIRLSYRAVKFVKHAHFSMESFSGQALPMPSKDFFLMKNESIFGLISNCRNGSNERGNLVQLITNLYPVDLYGKCAWEKKNKDFCTRKLGCSKELREAVEKRLFHLVLENTDCLGYVTEKTFDRIGYDSIPIGIRRDAYEKAGLPVGAFIFLDDFESPQMFVDHLRYLESNETAYIEYFQWRNEYSIVKNEESWCELCRKLNTKDNPLKETKMIKNIYKEYATCFAKSIWKSFVDKLKESMIPKTTKSPGPFAQNLPVYKLPKPKENQKT